MPIIREMSIRQKFRSYPDHVEIKMMQLRDLMFQVAREHPEIGPVTEALKWGEPSYLTRYGSTIRIDWKPEDPDRIWLFFHCKTLLVDTFRSLFPDTFQFQDNRSASLPVSRELPATVLKRCIFMAMYYHKLKHLPLLGENSYLSGAGQARLMGGIR